MTDISQIKAFFSNDLFVKNCDIEIINADKGFCECKMTLSDKHLNADGVVQGGAIYTLADFTFAVAANCEQKITVTRSGNITYLKAGKGSFLTCKSEKISKGKSACLYESKVYDEKGMLIALATFNGFIRQIN